MYELKIGAYKDFDKTFTYIHSSFLPRKGEIIKKFKFGVYEEDDSLTEYYFTLEVQAVHYELFEDNSTMPVVYANVIKSELIGSDVDDE